MRLLRVLVRRFRSLFARRDEDRALSRELAFHLEELEQEFQAEGLSPEEARLAARRAMGNITQQAEQCRDTRRVTLISDFFRDLRFAALQARKAPAFTTVLVLSLALGIGANASVFSLFHALMLKMLPVERPEDLVVLKNTGGWGSGFVSYRLYTMLRDRDDLHSGLAARSTPGSVRLGVQGSMERASQEYVSGEYFHVLGIHTQRGRLIDDADNQTLGASPVAVISHDFWQKRFGASEDIVGRSIVLDEKPYTVVGVAQPGFRGVELERATDVWVPIMMGHKPAIENGGIHWLWLIARRNPNLTDPQLESGANAIYRGLLEELHGKATAGFRERATAQRLQFEDGSVGLSVLRERYGEPIRLLMGAVILMLLVACINVAGLLLARGATRLPEMALRISLGAGRWRLFRQSFAESAFVGGLGLLAGWLIAKAANTLAPVLLPDLARPDAPAISVNAEVWLFLALASLCCVALFGLLPAFQAARSTPTSGLRASKVGAASLPGKFPVRSTLVALQVALSFALVVVAVLFARSLENLRLLEPGLHNRQVLSFWVPTPGRYSDQEAANLREELRRRLTQAPGVSAVALASPGPYQMGTQNTSVRTETITDTTDTSAAANWSEFVSCTPEYLPIIGAKLLRGRYFEERDASKVAVVNERFLKQFFDGQDPIGKTIEISVGERRIVGVVGNIRHYGLREQERPFVYVPITADLIHHPAFLVAARSDADALSPVIRETIHQLNPALEPQGMVTLRSMIDKTMEPEWLLSILCTLFGGVTLLLAAVGIYGLMSHWVVQRRQELGVRLALGATKRDVAMVLIRRGASLTVAGLLTGLPVAYLATRVAESMLFRVQATALDIWSVCFLTSLAAAGLALLTPLRAALRLQPADVLRVE